MVELCELNLTDRNLESQWPVDIDQHIAQLDFQRSSDEEEVSLFSSSMALDDPTATTIISTDSLDIDKLHAQCEVNKNDYKLTFEDSEQWTSGGNLTTWGRIHSAEPLDEKTNSLPELGADSGGQRLRNEVDNRRPSSLLTTFVGRQPLESTDWYTGNGRFVDVNDNEISFLSPSTATATDTATDTADTGQQNGADRWRRAAVAQFNLPPSKPHRTFADFQAERAPQLDFMQMDHNMPSLCQSSASFSEILDRMKEGVLDDDKLDFSMLSTLEKRGIGPDSGLGSSATASSGPVHIEDWPSLAVLLPKHVAEACSFFKNNSRLLTGSNSIERTASTRRAEACRTCFSVKRRLHPPIWAQPSSARYVLCDCTTSEIVDRNLMSTRNRAESVGRLKLRAQELSIVGLPIYDSKRKLVENVVEGVAEVAHNGSLINLCGALEALIADGLKVKHTWEMIVKLTAPGPATNSIYSLVNEMDNGEKSQNSRVSVFFSELLKLGALDCWISYVVLKENVLSTIYFDGAFMLRASTAYRSLLWRLLENLELLTLLEQRSVAGGAASQDASASSSSSRATNTLLLGASLLASDSRVPKSSSMPARLCGSRRCDNDCDEQSANPAATLGVTPRPLSDMTTHILRRSRIPTLSVPHPKRTRSSSDGPQPQSLGDRNSSGGTTRVARRNTSQTLRGSIVSVSADVDRQGLLKVACGERVRVLAIRGHLSRCYRVHPRHDCVMQGLLPTANLVPIQ